MLVLAVGGVVAVAFSRALHSGAVYDEGVYLASLDALEHGQRLGADVFTSQPPGFYVLLEAERAVAGASIVAMHAAMLVLALIGCLTAYYIGRCIAGPKAGLLAMMLLAAPSRVEDQAVQVRADLPSVTLSLIAIASALFSLRRQPRWAQLGGAALAGIVLAAAISVKLLAVTTVVPVVVIFILARDPRRALAAAAGAAAVVAALLSVYHGVLGQIWGDAVRYHLMARTAAMHGAPHSIRGNVDKIIGTLSDFKGVLHSPFPWLFILGAAASLLAWRRRRELLPLWLWVASSAVFVALNRPLWAHDVVMLTASLAVASGIGIATLFDDARILSRVLATGCAFIIAATLLHHLPRSSPSQDPDIASAAAFLRNHTAPGSEVASDLPIIPFLADRREPGPLVDTSWTRVGSGWLTPTEFLHTLERDHVGAVILGHNLNLDAPLLKALRTRFVKEFSELALALPGERAHKLEILLPRTIKKE